MSCRPHDYENSSCFEILGFDVMIDYKLRPWLLEVNHSPSFNTDSDLDKDVKMTVIGDTIKLLNLSSTRKEQYKKQRSELLNSRMMGTNKKISVESKKVLMNAHDKERDKFESQTLGGYEQLLPSKNPKYKEYLETAKKVWTAFNSSNL